MYTFLFASGEKQFIVNPKLKGNPKAITQEGGGRVLFTIEIVM
jgi:hypothetical protein